MDRSGGERKAKHYSREDLASVRNMLEQVRASQRRAIRAALALPKDKQGGWTTTPGRDDLAPEPKHDPLDWTVQKQPPLTFGITGLTKIRSKNGFVAALIEQKKQRLRVSRNAARGPLSR